MQMVQYRDLRQDWLVKAIHRVKESTIKMFFSPVTLYNSIRALFAVANTRDWDIHQMDVKTAFLQGDWMKRFS